MGGLSPERNSALLGPGLEVRVVWGDPAPKASPFRPERLVSAYATLAGWGGFAGSRRSPGRAAARFALERVDVQHGHWVLAMEEAEPGAVWVLDNVLRFSHEQVAALRERAIHCSLSAVEPPPPRLLGHVSPLPFDCSIAADSCEVHVRVEFAEEPSPKQAAEIAAVLHAWRVLTSAGGFEPPEAKLDDPFLIFTDDPVWLGDEVAMVLDDASFDEAAFDALINALVAIHQRLLPVVALEVD